MTQVGAIDWSGRHKGEAEAIWLAIVVDGQLTDLENGRDRREVIGKAIALAAIDRTVLGLDFAFGFPAWYSEREGWTSGREIWDAMGLRAEGILSAPEPPFWGRPGTKAQQLATPTVRRRGDSRRSRRASLRSAGPEPWAQDPCAA